MYIFLGDESQGDKQGSLCGKLSDGVDWEMVAIENMDVAALIGALKGWRSCSELS